MLFSLEERFLAVSTTFYNFISQMGEVQRMNKN